MAAYEDITATLEQAYNAKAVERDQGGIPAWKRDEAVRFLDLLLREEKRSLLEIGSGPGHCGCLFREAGLHVICTDLSPEMVRLCRAKGLTAYVMDFLNLDFPDAHFDAVFALNCLLHVPKAELPPVLASVRRVIKPHGLLYAGLYGGREHEGVWDEDTYEPKRFFSFYTDEQMRALITRFFDLVSFRTRAVERGEGLHFQSLIGRKLAVNSEQSPYHPLTLSNPRSSARSVESA